MIGPYKLAASLVAATANLTCTPDVQSIWGTLTLWKGGVTSPIQQIAVTPGSGTANMALVAIASCANTWAYTATISWCFSSPNGSKCFYDHQDNVYIKC